MEKGLLILCLFLAASVTAQTDFEKCSFPSDTTGWRELFNPYEKPNCTEFWKEIIRSVHTGKAHVSIPGFNPSDYFQIASIFQIPYWIESSLREIPPHHLIERRANQVARDIVLMILRNLEKQKKEKLTPSEILGVRIENESLAKELSDYFARTWLIRAIFTPFFSSVDKALMYPDSKVPIDPKWPFPEFRRELWTKILDEDQVKKDRLLSSRGYPTFRQFLWDELHTSALSLSEQKELRMKDPQQTLHLIMRYNEIAKPLEIWIPILPRVTDARIISGGVRGLSKTADLLLDLDLNFASKAENYLQVSPSAPLFWNAYHHSFTKFMRDSIDRDYALNDGKNVTFNQAVDTALLGMNFTAWKGITSLKLIPLLVSSSITLGFTFDFLNPSPKIEFPKDVLKSEIHARLVAARVHDAGFEIRRLSLVAGEGWKPSAQITFPSRTRESIK